MFKGVRWLWATAERISMPRRVESGAGKRRRTDAGGGDDRGMSTKNRLQNHVLFRSFSSKLSWCVQLLRTAIALQTQPVRSQGWQAHAFARFLR